MRQPITITHERPIRRTLIVSLGPLAAAVHHMLPPAFAPGGELAGAVALLPADDTTDDPTEAIRRRLATISRTGARAELAAAGYVPDRLRELALFILIDLTDPAAAGRAAALAALAANLARDGWGLDTRLTVIALAADWAADAPRQGLQALADAVGDMAAAIIPLNHVNEEGLEADGPEAFARTAATLVELLAATTLRDALQWAEPAVSLAGPTLTAVGLSRWVWSPEPARDASAAQWRAAVIDQWLAPARAEQNAVVAQLAAGWFSARGLLPQALIASLEEAIAAYEVPAWPVPWPWAAAAAIDRLRHLSAALDGGRAGAVQLVLADREEWAAEQEAALQSELARQLDREPVAGFALADLFLRELDRAADDAAGVVDFRRDQMEEWSRDPVARPDGTLGQIDAILRKWPPDSPAGWLSMLARPWRWPGLARDYRRLHILAKELERGVARQAGVEREQVVMAAAAALYRRYGAIIERAAGHLDEARDMLRAARPPAAFHQPDGLAVGRLSTIDNIEQETVEAAAALGGLGWLAPGPDEGLVEQLRVLSRERFRFLIDLSAVEVLEQTMSDETAIAAWWAERWAEAAPLWLVDDAGRPEAVRGMDCNLAAVCAAGPDRLRAWLGLPDRPDRRWLPSGDKYHIDILRWRTGLAL